MVRPSGAYSVLKERGKRLIGGNDVSVDGVGDLLGQALLVFGRDVRWILHCWEQKRVSVDDSLTLNGKFLREKSDGHELVLHASAKDFGGLGEDAGNLVKTRDVVFVVFDGVERDGKRQIGEAGMDAILLVDRHLVLFEVEVGDALLEDANQEVARELVLVRETRARNRFQPGEEGLVSLVALDNGVE